MGSGNNMGRKKSACYTETIKTHTLAIYGRKSGSCLEKEVGSHVYAQLADQRRLGSTTSHHGLVYYYTSYWKEQRIEFVE